MATIPLETYPPVSEISQSPKRSRRTETSPVPPALSPDPDLLRKDPMAEIFGPGSPVKLLHDNDDEQMPDEVRGVLEQYGLSKCGFQCTLKEIPEGSTIGETGSSSNTAYIKSWNRSIPSMEYIARNWGPGTYLLQFAWRVKDESTENKSVPMHQEVTVEVSQKYMTEYKKHRLQEKIKNAKELGASVKESLIEDTLERESLKGMGIGMDGQPTDPKLSAKAYLTEIKETAAMLGLPMFNSAPPAPIKPPVEWDKFLPAIITGAAAILKIFSDADSARREESNKLFMLMMTQGQQSSNQLLEIFKTTTGVGSGNMAIKEFKDMVLGALDIKNALGSAPETLGDKIFRVIEGVAPQILTIAATAAQAAALRNTPQGKMAQAYVNANPDMQALKNNPAEMKKFVDNLDNFYGWEQADAIMTVGGWERPETCPRDPMKKDPPQNVETEDNQETPSEAQPPVQ